VAGTRRARGGATSAPRGGRQLPPLRYGRPSAWARQALEISARDRHRPRGATTTTMTLGRRCAADVGRRHTNDRHAHHRHKRRWRAAMVITTTRRRQRRRRPSPGRAPHHHGGGATHGSGNCMLRRTRARAPRPSRSGARTPTSSATHDHHHTRSRRRPTPSPLLSATTLTMIARAHTQPATLNPKQNGLTPPPYESPATCIGNDAPAAAPTSCQRRQQRAFVCDSAGRRDPRAYGTAAAAAAAAALHYRTPSRHGRHNHRLRGGAGARRRAALLPARLRVSRPARTP
jgi:hypothetical protein